MDPDFVVTAQPDLALSRQVPSNASTSETRQKLNEQKSGDSRFVRRLQVIDEMGESRYEMSSYCGVDGRHGVAKRATRSPQPCVPSKAHVQHVALRLASTTRDEGMFSNHSSTFSIVALMFSASCQAHHFCPTHRATCIWATRSDFEMFLLEAMSQLWSTGCSC